YQLLQADMREIRNNLTHFRLMGIKESEWICDQLRKTASPERKIRFIEQWLERKLTGKPPATGLTEQATRTIIEQKGLVLVSELSRQFNVNRKYLERHFSLELGLSPKEFAGIIRFNYLSSLLLEQAISWKELTYLGRFHDQSHLIKHFNRVTGLTPGAFRQMIDEHPEARFVKRHNVYTLVLNDAEEPVCSPVISLADPEDGGLPHNSASSSQYRLPAALSRLLSRPPESIHSGMHYPVQPRIRIQSGRLRRYFLSE